MISAQRTGLQSVKQDWETFRFYQNTGHDKTMIAALLKTRSIPPSVSIKPWLVTDRKTDRHRYRHRAATAKSALALRGADKKHHYVATIPHHDRDKTRT